MAAAAQDAPGLTAPDAEQIIQFVWAGEASLIAITQNEAGYGVFRVELADGQWLPVSMPPSFTRLKPPNRQFSGHVKEIDFVLSPDGSGLAVLEHAPEPLIAPLLSVYRWTANGYRSVDTRGLPPGFWPSLVAWDDQGQQLFIAAREYLFPDQLYSIGALDSSRGEFNGVVIKGNIDLVDELTYLPMRQALAVRCRGYQGEYPVQSIIVLIELSARQYSILHSEADEHQLLGLANGELVVLEPIDSGDAAGWVLAIDALQLSRAQFEAGSASETLQTSRDGQWLGYITKGGNGQAGSGLVLQRAANGQKLTTDQNCSMFAFSINSGYVCALDAGRTRFTFYQLPDG